MWNGDVLLTNVLFRKQTIEIGYGLAVSMEYGHVDIMRLQVPWSRLQSGEMQVTLENMELVLQLRVDDLNATVNKPSLDHVSKIVCLLFLEFSDIVDSCSQ